MNSSELRGYLTGLIIGDGYIESCSSFEMDLKYTPEKTDSKGVHHKANLRLRIKAHPYFAKKYHHFFDDNRGRTVSSEACSWLTPNGLANWYMSDGYVCLVGKTKGFIRDRRIDFCTDRYPKYIVERLAATLNEKFQLDTSIIKRGKFYRIRIKSNSYQTFINIIYPYLTPSMQYKLYLGYECQPRWMEDWTWELQKSLKSAMTLTSNVEG